MGLLAEVKPVTVATEPALVVSSAKCSLGFLVEDSPAHVVLVVGCGNGVRTGAEECDDFNSESGDGCSSSCRIERGLGWTCAGNPSNCSLCGDGVRVGAEQCDDSNLNDGDGCSSLCTTEVLDCTVGVCGTLVLDGGYNGSLASMACQAVVFEGTGNDRVRYIERVGVGVSTTWVGDLTIKLRSPAGTNVTLLSRPGVEEFADDGEENAGFSTFWGGVPVHFFETALTDAELLGSAGILVCSGDGRCSYRPNPGAAVPTTLAQLSHESVVGNWQICVGDGFEGDISVVTSTSLEIVRMP